MNRSKQRAGMGKKTMVVWLVALALAPFHLAEAQQQAKVAKIGWLGVSSLSRQAPSTELFRRDFVVEWRLLMETDTARAIVKAIYPTIIVITVMLLAASLL